MTRRQAIVPRVELPDGSYEYFLFMARQASSSATIIQPLYEDQPMTESGLKTDRLERFGLGLDTTVTFLGRVTVGDSPWVYSFDTTLERVEALAKAAQAEALPVSMLDGLSDHEVNLQLGTRERQAIVRKVINPLRSNQDTSKE